MTTKKHSSELQMNLKDKDMETTSLKVANEAMAAHIQELKDDNGSLEEEACGLFDKVNNNLS